MNKINVFFFLIFDLLSFSSQVDKGKKVRKLTFTRKGVNNKKEVGTRTLTECAVESDFSPISDRFALCIHIVAF